jgi:hypothetical protein
LKIHILLFLQVKQEGKESQVLQTLTGHKGKVNCIKWIPAIDYGN